MNTFQRNSIAFYLALFTFLFGFVCSNIYSDTHTTTAEEALKQLKEGNKRYIDGISIHPNSSKDRRAEITKSGQHPYATVIGCSDSRAPIEILFDAGFGDIFVIRVPGNVCDIDEIASIEYGVEHLHTPLLVVLGHTHCGAVTTVSLGAEVHGHLPKLVDNIKPAVSKLKIDHPELYGNPFIEEAVKYNVWQSIEDLLKNSSITRELVAENKLKIIGAVFDIETAEIQWLGEHPEQAKLLRIVKSSK